MIESLQDFPRGVVAFTGKGQITKQDYETVLIPSVEEALKQPGKLRLYYQIGPDFSGMEAGALWEDFKIGVEHRLRWERIAVVTDVDWIQYTIRAFAFTVPATVRLFSLSDEAQAREWITEGMARPASA